MLQFRMRCLQEALHQLTNPSHYKQLEQDPTKNCAFTVKTAVSNMFNRNIIHKHTKNFLSPCNPKAARFYLLPKIHKPGNPGHPIVASNGAPTENISAFVDYHLHPLDTTLPSYIQDTSDVISSKASDTTTPTRQCTFDVASLFTNIPHSEGLEACRAALDTRSTPSPSTTPTTSRSKGQPWVPAWPPHMQTSL